MNHPTPTEKSAARPAVLVTGSLSHCAGVLPWARGCESSHEIGHPLKRSR